MSIKPNNTKAIKVTDSTPETSQLETFINNLGIDKKAELYLYNNQAFINVDIIMQILSVDPKWFIKNSESPTHYITIKKQIYVNKYGLTKILAQSKEAVAFQLQDYIYEVIYKLETNKFVHQDDIESRAMLAKTLAELDIYKTVEDNNKLMLSESEHELKQLETDYAILQQDNNKLLERYEKLLDDFSAINKEHESLKNISKV